MRINLREEETAHYISLFENYLDDIQVLNQKVTDVLNEVMLQSKYDKLQRTISDIMDTYGDMIVNDIETGAFHTWEESDASLRSCLRRYRAGDAADAVCAQVEQSLNDLMQDILKIDKDEILITERPIVNEEGLDRLEDICRSANTELLDIKANYKAKISACADENEIFDTLIPLVENIAINMETFFDTSLRRFEQLHEFARTVAAEIQRRADEYNGGDSHKGSKNGQGASSQNKESQSSQTNPGDLRKITEYIYDTLSKEQGEEKKTLSYEMMSQIADVYYKFYHKFGSELEDNFENQEERENFIQREYIQVTRERGNDKYFKGEEVWTFKSHACRTYTVFDKVAEMEKNIAEACIKGEAEDTNLVYGAYVLLTPVLKCNVKEKSKRQFDDFEQWAVDEIKRIIGINNILDENDTINFTGEKFSDENIKLFVYAVEKIINQVGVDELNDAVDKNYDSLKDSRKIYSESPSRSGAQRSNIAADTYGRYTVTDQSIHIMEPLCAQMNSVLEPLDQFYKDKFKKLGESFDKANSTVHALSSFIGLWGLGTWNLTKLFSTEDSDKHILEKISMGSLALSSCSTVGMIINGGAHLIKILDWAMPHMKKSKLLVKLNEKVWNLTREDIQVPYMNKYMDQYMMEYYENKYGMLKGKSGKFEFYHRVVGEIEEEHQRRAFENAVFSAESWLNPQHYTINTDSTQKYWEICYGIFLNLVRSGMCSKQNIESGTANDIVDKLYDCYVSKRNVNPRVDTNPTTRNIDDM